MEYWIIRQDNWQGDILIRAEKGADNIVNGMVVQEISQQ
jgi:hypothetical protein